MLPASRLRALSYFVLLSVPCAFSSGGASRQTSHGTPARPAGGAPAPERLQQLYEHAITAMKQDRLAEARADLESLLRANPKSAELHDFLGYVMLRQSEYDPAISELKKALEIRPGFQQARVHLA